MADKVNLEAAFLGLEEPWVPRIAAALNGQHVKLVRFEGEFVWHRHAAEDELFWVVRGRVRIRLRDREVALGPGEFFVVPRGTEHQPVADEPSEVVLFEPASTRNTGDVTNEQTRERLDWIA